MSAIARRELGCVRAERVADDAAPCALDVCFQATHCSKICRTRSHLRSESAGDERNHELPTFSLSR